MSHIRGEMPWGQDFRQQALHKVCFLLYQEFYSLICTNQHIPEDLSPLTKEFFKEKHHI